MRHVQDDPKTALVWAQQRIGKNKASFENIKKLVKRLDQPRYTPKETPAKPKSAVRNVKPPVQSSPPVQPSPKAAPQSSGAQLSSPASPKPAPVPEQTTQPEPSPPPELAPVLSEEAPTE